VSAASVARNVNRYRGHRAGSSGARPRALERPGWAPRSPARPCPQREHAPRRRRAPARREGGQAVAIGMDGHMGRCPTRARERRTRLTRPVRPSGSLWTWTEATPTGTLCEVSRGGLAVRLRRTNLSIARWRSLESRWTGPVPTFSFVRSSGCGPDTYDRPQRLDWISTSRTTSCVRAGGLRPSGRSQRRRTLRAERPGPGCPSGHTGSDPDPPVGASRVMRSRSRACLQRRVRIPRIEARPAVARTGSTRPTGQDPSTRCLVRRRDRSDPAVRARPPGARAVAA